MIYETKRVAALSVGDDLERQLAAGSGRSRGLWGGIGVTVTIAVSGLSLLGSLAVVMAVLQGWRPVVIQTGSMEPTIPVGALVLAQPQPAEDLGVGQVLVMRPASGAPVTHRITDVDYTLGLVTTRGDANPSVDPAPYPVGDEELVARFVVAGGGTLLVAAGQPWVPTTLTVLAVLILLPAIFRETAAEVWRIAPKLRKKCNLET